jgi:hypothetical protein
MFICSVHHISLHIRAFITNLPSHLVKPKRLQASEFHLKKNFYVDYPQVNLEKFRSHFGVKVVCLHDNIHYESPFLLFQVATLPPVVSEFRWSGPGGGLSTPHILVVAPLYIPPNRTWASGPMADEIRLK